MRKILAAALFASLALSASSFAQRTSVSGDFPIYDNGFSGTFDEGVNMYTNVVLTPIHIPDPRNKVDLVD